MRHLPDAAIIAAIEANINGYFLNYAHAPQTTLYDGPVTLAVVTGIPWEGCNAILRATLDPVTLDAQIEAALLPFRRDNVPMLWHIGPSTQPHDLGGALLAHGLSHYEDEPGMAADLRSINHAPLLPSGLTIEPVVDDAGLIQWFHTWGFEVPESFLKVCVEFYSHLVLGPQRPLRFYLGRIDGEPVATPALFFGAGVASVQHVVTVPHARRHGIGAAMTAEIMRTARAEGCALAALTASPLGVNIYRRLGFRDYCIFSHYLWTPPPQGD